MSADIRRLIGEAEEDFSEYEDLLKLDAEQEKTLFSRDPRMTPEQAFEYAESLRYLDVPDYVERAIAKSPVLSLKYAFGINFRRFPLGEPAIATDAELSFSYAVNVLDHGDFVQGSRRFPLGEPAIASSPAWAAQYASRVLKSRFTEAEPVIKDSPYWDSYKNKFNIP